MGMGIITIIIMVRKKIYFEPKFFTNNRFSFTDYYDYGHHHHGHHHHHG
jgi:hypothetical protein